MKKTIVIGFGVLIAVVGILDIGAHLAEAMFTNCGENPKQNMTLGGM